VNYVLEYYNNYIDTTEADELTYLMNEKVNKYRHTLRNYDQEIIDWLVEIFSDHGKQMNRIIGNLLKNYDFFYLFNTDNEFRSSSYDCYSKLIKKYPFLKDQSEMLFLFIKDHHRVISSKNISFREIHITDSIDEWVENTWTKYGVNLIEFSFRLADDFFNNNQLWPVSHRKKSNTDFRDYDYVLKNNDNLFNINSLYRKIPKKNFIKGRKQHLEALIMYHWLHFIEGDEENYWPTYLNKLQENEN
jgi:hypothetical protein